MSAPARLCTPVRRTRRLSILALALALALASLTAAAACGGAAAQAPAPATQPAPAAAPAVATNPLLWKIESDQGSAFLYGTLHTGGAQLVPGPAWDALATCTTFVMETDIEAIDQGELMGRAVLPPGQSLEQLMSADGWNRLVLAFQGKLSADQLKRFKPWFASIVLVQMWLSGEATDMALKKQATRQGARLAYLETWQEQLDALEAGTDVASLELMLADLDLAKQQLDELVAAYAAGDLDAILRFTTDPASGMSAVALEKLLYARNRNWVPKIEALVAGGGAFIAVGAGHIPGPGGLLELLGARGFRVTRVGR